MLSFPKKISKVKLTIISFYQSKIRKLNYQFLDIWCSALNCYKMNTLKNGTLNLLFEEGRHTALEAGLIAAKVLV